MHVILLGTAAGGGFPQWNCWCRPCRTARSAPRRAQPRTQSSIAVSADGGRWVLCNASPDVRAQLANVPSRVPDSSVVRAVPIEGVVLTDAELDHTVGLLLLREARTLHVYAPAPVEDILEYESRILPTLRAFADVTVTRLPRPSAVESAIALVDRDDAPLGLTVETFLVAGDPPRFAPGSHGGHAVGLIIRQPATGASIAFVPGVGAIDEALAHHLRQVDAVLFDGTCFADDEMIAYGISHSHARQMGHVPIAGDDGSLALLKTLAPRVCVYTHINNTNPILINDSPERQHVEAAGITVGHDGMRLTVDSAHQTLLSTT